MFVFFATTLLCIARIQSEQVIQNDGITCVDGQLVGNGESYIGTLSTTVSGKTCQRWDSQTPHAHSRTPQA